MKSQDSKILSRILHSRSPHLGSTNGDVQSYLATLAFKNRSQHEYFHRRIIRLQQENILSGETISPTRLLFQYIKALSNIDKLKALIVLKMTDITTFLDKNRKPAVYTGGNIH